MVKWFLFFVFSGIVVLFTTLYFNLGAYKEVTMTEVDEPEFHIIYKKHVGPYHKIAPVIIEVETWATKNNVSCSKTFGEYMDDPKVVDEDRLRSHGGCIVTTKPEITPEGFEYRLVPAARFLKAQFGGAPSIGPFVVYPKVTEWFDTHRKKMGGPIFEIYNIQGDKSALTEYLFPL